MTVDLTFSQRYGYDFLPKPMQLGELSSDLRREIYNCVRSTLLAWVHTPDTFPHFHSQIEPFLQWLWGNLLGKPEDEIDTSYHKVMDTFKNWILRKPFNKVFDLIEQLSHWRGREIIQMLDNVRGLFEGHMAAYYLSEEHPYQIRPRSNIAQGEATEQAMEAVRKSGMGGADTHLRRSVEHLNTQQYADSIRDSIHAVESVARTICSDKNTLDDALKSLERRGLVVHPALKNAFQKLYAYTNDEQGIRHALLEDEAKVGLDEALFMFGACASFAAFLVAKYQEFDQQMDDER